MNVWSDFNDAVRKLSLDVDQQLLEFTQFKMAAVEEQNYQTQTLL